MFTPERDDRCEHDGVCIKIPLGTRWASHQTDPSPPPPSGPRKNRTFGAPLRLVMMRGGVLEHARGIGMIGEPTRRRTRVMLALVIALLRHAGGG